MDATRAVNGLYACGHSLFTQERIEDAAAVFRALAAVSPGSELGWLGLAACHEKIGQHALAAELYKAGEDLARSARCALALVRVLRELDHDGADDALARAEELAAGDPDLEQLVSQEKTS